MKNILLTTFVLLVTQVSFASDSRTLVAVVEGPLSFPSGEIDSYVQGSSGDLLKEAKRLCLIRNQEVKTISNVNIQVFADFTMKVIEDEVDTLRAVSYPKTVTTALVLCN